MALDRITLGHFRNHAASRLDGAAHLNLLIGENGAGKTNVLEALSLFAPGRGLRRAALTDMASSAGPGTFSVSAALHVAGGEPVMLGTGTQPDRLCRRIVQVNGAETSAVSLGEWLAVSWLTPAMDGLFTDSAGARRRYMDRLALALDPSHARHAARYEAALRERNRLLAGPGDPDPAWLDGIEAQLAETGSALAAGRRRLIERLTAVSPDVAEAMAKGALERSRADIALSVTGWAEGGPDPSKPAGLVYFASARPSRPTLIREERFGDIGRARLRIACLQTALEMMLERMGR